MDIVWVWVFIMSCVCCWLAESIVSIVSYVLIFIKAGCAWAWTRARTSTNAECIMDFVACVNTDVFSVMCLILLK